MNYLAHAYLSFNQPEILVGNMISDYVKGKKKFDYPLHIQQGITLHRLIDSFTDSHAVTSKAKTVFKPAVGLYAGAFMDVVYDHFLAMDENIFTSAGLENFAVNTYHRLDKFESLMPQKFALMYPYMKKHDWLSNYRFTWAIERSFGGIASRALYLEPNNQAYDAFLKEYNFLNDSYHEFFPELQKYAAEIFATFHI